MDQVSNPYVPGAGRPPAALVGRDESIATWRVCLQRVESGRSAQSVVLYGLRGVGKTVLLNRLAADAEDRGWIVAQVEAGVDKSLRESLSEALQQPLTDLVKASMGSRVRRALKTATSFKAGYGPQGWTFGLDLSAEEGGGADSGQIEFDLQRLVRDIAAVARHDQSGLAILIDEAQDLSREELRAICATAHLASQRGWSVLFGLAGLPSLPRVLAEAKSYAERLFIYESVEQLSPPIATRALLEPAALEDVTWNPDAAALVVEQTDGYPYFLQQFGQEAWNEAAHSPITHVDARVACAKGLAALDAGFFRSRWERATRSEQVYLKAMAADGDPASATRDIAERMDRSIQSLGPARASLIHKGLVYAPEHGRVAFTVPGMAAFINRQAED
jgi:hypothetical protein